MISPVGRLSFPSLFEPTAFTTPQGQQQDPKYSATLIFPDPKELTPIKDECNAFINEKWPGLTIAGVEHPFRKCSEKPDMAGYADYPDGIFVKFASSGDRPAPPVVRIFNGEKVPIEKSEGLIYGGCWVRVAFNLYSWAFAGKKGISFGLSSVLLVRKDTAFGVPPADPERDFAEVTEEYEDGRVTGAVDSSDDPF